MPFAVGIVQRLIHQSQLILWDEVMLSEEVITADLTTQTVTFVLALEGRNKSVCVTPVISSQVFVSLLFFMMCVQ